MKPATNSEDARQLLRQLPSVDRVVHALPGLASRHGHMRLVAAARAELDALRAAVRSGQLPSIELTQVSDAVAQRLARDEKSSLTPVLNLTGTLVHTNLGRAVLPERALAAVQRVGQMACNLEYDLHAGKRGDRDSHVESLLCELTGAEAATVVNNNAAAVLLVLNTLALNREVPVSRGQLIEIGDAFRIPDIMARSGARLVEVGTTNRTHARDYEQALSADTAALMHVHTSNYVVQGFTKEVPMTEMSAIAHANGLPMISDLGSGTLVDLADWGLPRELTVTEVLGAGVNLVTFSGDKLLGGPQTGMIVGDRDLMAAIKRNPIRRALR
ncbi:MAG: L-seryl-tRNA(Sec) selenium transferase, partial [Pseudomonadota bacterium]